MNIGIAPGADKVGPGIQQIATAWLTEFGQAAIATVVSTWGSSPVPVGGQLVIAPDGRFEGSISGGCVEVEVIVEAQAVMERGKPALLSFGVDDETAWSVGLPCGGTIQVLLEALNGETDRAFLEALLNAAGRRAPLFVVTDVETGMREYGESLALPEEIAAKARAGKSFLAERGETQIFVHALMPVTRLLIVGASHIAQHLCALARTVGYDVVVVDPRSAFSTAARFGDVDLRVEWPEAAIPEIGLDGRTAVVVLSHVAQLDDEALRLALRSGCLYIGALGSKRTHANRLERLRAAGFSEDELARIHAPIGLNIGAVGPAEIAVSILAEVIQTARTGDL
ncbi:XdhC/CoxI family protein [Methyloligella sp. 2.7D]|uniref:XdhC family protein n=1 Tax=unclassified Methyloligella TaxID=2625955 RepID=UPI00157C9C15|nr:XdhC/CoxI family protein [Methyloligella sp. GL2]QKP76714.1 XdhC family protein [Methyloligella sp. GL2]